MADVLLINTAYNKLIYKNAKIKSGVPVNPLLNLALLAAPVMQAGYSVRILDLNVEDEPDVYLEDAILKENPALAGITFTTPLYREAKRLAAYIKELRQDMILVAGGPHATTFPAEILKESAFDVVAVGEADFVMRDLLLNKDKKVVRGIVFKESGNILQTNTNEFLNNLDDLPFPQWDLYNLKKYMRPSLSNRMSPSGYIETSRGCPWGCVFCNKNIQGRKFRPKSPVRVVDEIQYMLKSGFNEINILDDAFSTDIDRAKIICDEIVARGLKFPWHPTNGIRVNCVDRELFLKMKKAGCYKVSFGIESGNQDVLNGIDKNINLEQVRKAVRWAKEIGLETFGYFMIGLPGDTEETIRETIRFAKELRLDFARFSITIPFPGTKLFEAWDSQGLIKTKDWNKYNCYSPRHELYNHPSLSHELLEKYYHKAHRKFYFSPSYLARRIIISLKDGVFFRDLRLFLKTNWFS